VTRDPDQLDGNLSAASPLTFFNTLERLGDSSHRSSLLCGRAPRGGLCNPPRLGHRLLDAHVPAGPSCNGEAFLLQRRCERGESTLNRRSLSGHHGRAEGCRHALCGAQEVRSRLWLPGDGTDG
jgi:hypothetical protein